VLAAEVVLADVAAATADVAALSRPDAMEVASLIMFDTPEVEPPSMAEANDLAAETRAAVSVPTGTGGVVSAAATVAKAATANVIDNFMVEREIKRYNDKK
jgi:hypothetical protein